MTGKNQKFGIVHRGSRHSPRVQQKIQEDGWLCKIKRPSVETEGRLTIACHMKILERAILSESRTKIYPESPTE